jgi:hypothetical protein
MFFFVALHMCVTFNPCSPPDTEIMAIGKDFLITVEMGHNSPIGRKMLAAGPLDLSAIKHCYLAVFVLWDQLNEDSFFQPYYRILPQVQ